MSRPTLQQLAYLIALADEGHFGRAADLCAVSQPALSSQIRELEHRLGTTLVERLSRGAQLTAEGEEVVARARLVLTQVDEIVESTQRGGRTLRGPVVLGAIPTVAPYVLGPVVSLVVRDYPDVQLRLEERTTDDLLGALRTGQIDLALCALPVPSEFTSEVLLRDEFVVALSTQHPLAAQTGALPLAALATEDVLLLSEGHCLRDQALSVCGAVQAEIADVRATSMATLVQMVAANVGVTLLPTTAIGVEARPGNGVLTRPLREAPYRDLVLSWRASSPRDAHYRALATAISAALQP